MSENATKEAPDGRRTDYPNSGRALVMPVPADAVGEALGKQARFVEWQSAELLRQLENLNADMDRAAAAWEVGR